MEMSPISAFSSVNVAVRFCLRLFKMLQIHDRSKVYGHPDKFVFYMKTHFYSSN